MVLQSSRWRTRLAWSALAAVWVGAIGVGFAVVLRYSATPGAPAETSSAWPASTSIERSGDKHTLLLFLHPHCPCSAASMEQLSRLLTKTRDRVAVAVLFDVPPDRDEAWARTALWEAATALPNVAVLMDHGGTEARRFQVRTSGQALLYGPDGRLEFEGGLTSARGHVGDSAAEAAIAALVRGETSIVLGASVFGCALFDADTGDARPK